MTRGEEMRDDGFDDEAVRDATELRRALYDYYGTGQGLDRARAATERFKDRGWFQARQFSSAVIAPERLAEPRFAYYRRLRFDPDTILPRISIPFLAVFGGRDRHVPVAASVSRLPQAFAASGNRAAVVNVFPDGGHFLQRVTDREWLRQPERNHPLVPVDGYLEFLGDWLKRAGRARP